MTEVTYGEPASPQGVPIGTAAVALGVSVDTLRRWETEGKIKSTRTLGGQRRYAPTELDRVRAIMTGAPEGGAA